MKRIKQNKKPGLFANRVRTEVEAYTPDFMLNNFAGYNMR